MFYRKKIKKLQKVQKELYATRKLLKMDLFPHCYSYERKSCIHNNDIKIRLAETISLIFSGRESFEALEKFCDKNFNISDAKDFFEELGHYFINLSGKLSAHKELEAKAKMLEEEEKELKRQLKID